MKDQRERLAKAITTRCVRQGFLEGLHFGTFPGSIADDYLDVKVVSPYGEIPWNGLCRISEKEMKELMKSVVNNIYTVLVNIDNPEFMEALLKNWGDRRTIGWDKPEVVPDLVLPLDTESPEFIERHNVWEKKQRFDEKDKPELVPNPAERPKQPDEI